MKRFKCLLFSLSLLLITSCGKEEYTYMIENELDEEVIMEAFTGTPLSDSYKEARHIIDKSDVIILAAIDRNKDTAERDGIDFTSGLSDFFSFRVDSLRFTFENQKSVSFGSFRNPSVSMNPLLDVDVQKMMTDKNEFDVSYKISQNLKNAAN